MHCNNYFLRGSISQLLALFLCWESSLTELPTAETAEGITPKRMKEETIPSFCALSPPSTLSQPRLLLQGAMVQPRWGQLWNPLDMSCSSPSMSPEWRLEQ